MKGRQHLRLIPAQHGHGDAHRATTSKDYCGMWKEPAIVFLRAVFEPLINSVPLDLAFLDRHLSSDGIMATSTVGCQMHLVKPLSGDHDEPISRPLLGTGRRFASKGQTILSPDAAN